MNNVISSSILVLITRLLQKSLGLISTLILARLLTPTDFGVVAFLALTTNLFYVLAVSGNHQYLLSKPEVDNDDLDTAISIDLVIKGIFWLILIVLAPTICSYFNFNNALHALYVSSAVIIIRALKNPGFLLYSKNLNYNYFLKLEVVSKLVSFLAVITWVFFDASFWAIVAGDIVAAVSMVTGSYILHPFRPRFRLKKFGEQWAFSKWSFLKGSIGYAKANLDQVFATKIFSSAQLGNYYMAKDISMLPAYSLINPACDPLLPSFSKVQQNANDFRYQIQFSFLVANLLSMPIAVYLYVFSTPLVELLLGPQWSSISQLVSAFSLLMYFSCLGPILVHACVAKQKIKAIFLIDLLSLLVLILSFGLIQNSGIEYLAWVKGIVHALIIITYLLYLKTLTNISFLRIIFLCFPTSVGCLSSFLVFDNFFNVESVNGIFSLVYFSGIFFITGGIVTVIVCCLYKDVVEFKHILNLVKQAVKR